MNPCSLIGSNKAIHFLVVVIYYLLVVLPHAIVGRKLNALFENYSRATYNIIILSLVLVGLCLGSWLLKEKIRAHPDRSVMILYILFSLIALSFCYGLLFVINIEAIHFVQYAFLAILLFPVMKSCRNIMSLTILLGAMDELYQYLVLDTKAPYYDFNDVLFDAIGAGLGLLFLKVIGAKTKLRSPSPWWKKLEWQLTLAVSVILLSLYATDLFAVNPAVGEPVFFTLFKKAPSGFWTYPPGPYARLHILTPIPGLLLIFGVGYIYGLLDKFRPTIELN